MRRADRRLALALAGLGSAVLLVSGALFADHYYGHGGSGRVLAEHPLPAALSAQPEPTQHPRTARTARPAGPASAPDRPGVPVRIMVPAHRVDARVTSNPLRRDGFVFVPADPRVVSWASGVNGQAYSAPGNNHGTAMLVSHVNFGGVPGAFHDLADYRPGERILLVLQDGRRLHYTVAAAPMMVSKSRLHDDLAVPGQPLHHELFDQGGTYGAAGTPRTGRLLLQSCGGAFDNRDGSYEDNVFVFALPSR